MSVVIDGDLVVVPPNGSVPKVCLRCGTKKGLAYQTVTFAEQSSAATGGAIGGACGATLVALGRQNAMFYWVGGAICVVVLALLVRQAQHAPKVEVEVPFCAACDAELRAIRSRWRSMGAVMLALVAVTAVLAIMEMWTVAAAGLVLVLLFTIWVSKQRFGDHFLRADRVTEGFVWIRGVGPNALKRLTKRAERRALAASPVVASFSPRGE